MAACQISPAISLLPEYPQPSPTPILSEVMMRIQLDYVDTHQLQAEKLFRTTLIALEQKIPELQVRLPHKTSAKATTQILLRRQPHVLSQQPPTSFYELHQQLQKLLVLVQEKFSAYEMQNLELWTLRTILAQIDQHSIVLAPELYAEFTINTRGNFAGVGIMVGLRNNQLTVISPIEGGPAERAGIQAKDVILKIDGENTENMSLSNILQHLRGKMGSQVFIEVSRQELDSPLQFQLTRESIHIASVESFDWEQQQQKFRFVRLKAFQENTAKELEKHLQHLEEVAGVILDLRNNPGGLLQEAIRVSDLFLPDKQIVVSTVDNRARKIYHSHQLLKDPLLIKIPLVILVNGGSASAAEIVSGALQHAQRAVIIGEQTFGKGSVQSVWPITGKAGLKLTIARYLTPNNQSIQSVGITPNLLLHPALVHTEKIRLLQTQRQRSPKAPDFRLQYLKTLNNSSHSTNSTSLAKQKIEQDYFVSLAAKYLLSNQESMNKKLQQVVDQADQEQQEVLIQALQKKGLDWQAGTSTLAKRKVKIDLVIEQKEDLPPNYWKKITGSLARNQKSRFQVTVRNLGIAPLSRVLVYSKSKRVLLNQLEFPIGRLKKGESRSWTFEFLPGNHPLQSWEPFQLIAVDHSGEKIGETNEVLGFDPLPEYKFKVAFQLWDDGRFNSKGNGDRKPQAGEIVSIHIKMTNRGHVKSRETTIQLQSDSSLTMLRDQLLLGELLPEQTKEGYFQVQIPPEIGSLGKWKLEVRNHSSHEAVFHYSWQADQNIVEQQLMPPKVKDLKIVDHEGLFPKTEQSQLRLQGTLFDDQQLQDAFIVLNGRKTHYWDFTQTKNSAYQLNAVFNLQLGDNRATLIFRDNLGLLSQKSLQFWREESLPSANRLSIDAQ